MRNDGTVLSLAGAARELGVSPATVGRWARRGLLPTVKIGPSRRVLRSTLDAFIREREVAALERLEPRA